MMKASLANRLKREKRKGKRITKKHTKATGINKKAFKRKPLLIDKAETDG